MKPIKKVLIMSKKETAVAVDLEEKLQGLIKSNAEVTKPTDTDRVVNVSSDAYKDGLETAGLTTDSVTAVRSYDKAFTRAGVAVVSDMALDIFKKEKAVSNVSTSAIPMMGNKLEVSVDRTRTLKNPGTGEAIVRHGYITVSATAGYASGKDIKTLRDELMETAKKTLA